MKERKIICVGSGAKPHPKNEFNIKYFEAKETIYIIGKQGVNPLNLPDPHTPKGSRRHMAWALCLLPFLTPLKNVVGLILLNKLLNNCFLFTPKCLHIHPLLCILQRQVIHPQMSSHSPPRGVYTPGWEPLC